MKNFRFYTVVAVITVMLSANAQAQPKQQCNWHNRMMSEKIAFITMELELTPEEAQVFWPIYNQVTKEKQEYQKKVKGAYQQLMEASADENTSEKDIDRLLDRYLEAKKALQTSTSHDAAKYRKVLSGKKVAKLYIAEEKFRRQHIRNFKGGQKEPGGQKHQANK